MLKRNLKRIPMLRPNFMRKFLMVQYRQIVDPTTILDRQENEKQQSGDIIQPYDKIYNPKRTLEFDRRGYLVLYSAVPLKNLTIYSQWPYAQLDSITAFLTLNYWCNWFSLGYNALYISMVGGWIASFLSRAFQFQGLMWYVSKISLMKGGKLLLVERSSLDGQQFKDWIEISKLNIISEDLTQFADENESDFLDEEGQLKHMLAVEVEDYVFKGYSIERQVIKFLQKGTVHDPELFEASLKGYHIDTSDFTINTAHNNRAFESIGNYQFNFNYYVSSGRFTVFIIKLLVPSNPSANLIYDQGRNKNWLLNLQKQTQNRPKFNKLREPKSKRLQTTENIVVFLSNINSQFAANSYYVNFKNLNAYQSPHPTNTDISNT